MGVQHVMQPMDGRRHVLQQPLAEVEQLVDRPVHVERLNRRQPLVFIPQHLGDAFGVPTVALLHDGAAVAPLVGQAPVDLLHRVLMLGQVDGERPSPIARILQLLTSTPRISSGLSAWV